MDPNFEAAKIDFYSWYFRSYAEADYVVKFARIFATNKGFIYAAFGRLQKCFGKKVLFAFPVFFFSLEESSQFCHATPNLGAQKQYFTILISVKGKIRDESVAVLLSDVTGN